MSGHPRPTGDQPKRAHIIAHSGEKASAEAAVAQRCTDGHIVDLQKAVGDLCQATRQPAHGMVHSVKVLKNQSVGFDKCTPGACSMYIGESYIRFVA